jgi:hypothetical protein
MIACVLAVGCAAATWNAITAGGVDLREVTLSIKVDTHISSPIVDAR